VVLEIKENHKAQEVKIWILFFSEPNKLNVENNNWMNLSRVLLNTTVHNIYSFGVMKFI